MPPCSTGNQISCWHHSVRQAQRALTELALGGSCWLLLLHLKFKWVTHQGKCWACSSVKEPLMMGCSVLGSSFTIAGSALFHWIKNAKKHESVQLHEVSIHGKGWFLKISVEDLLFKVIDLVGRGMLTWKQKTLSLTVLSDKTCS